MRKNFLLVLVLMAPVVFIFGCNKKQVTVNSDAGGMAKYIILEKMDDIDRIGLSSALDTLFSGEKTGIAHKGPETGNEYVISLQEVVQPNCLRAYLNSISPKENDPSKQASPITAEIMACIDENRVWEVW